MTIKKQKNNITIPIGFTSADTKKRLDWIKDKSGLDFKDDIQNSPEDLKGIIENHIGFMKIPMKNVISMICM